MGIDARIVFKVRQAKSPTDDWLRTTSFALCAAIGANKFMASDGLPPAQYETALDAWNAAFKAHPMFLLYERGRSHERWETIVADIGKAPALLRYAINLTEDYSDGDKLPPGKAYFQDGETMHALDPSEWFLSVSLWTRYYGVGYERGDLMTICAVAEWLEANLPGVVVYYGGDSSGVEATPFDEAARQALKRHYYSEAGRDYFRRPMLSRTVQAPSPPGCGLCVDKAQPQWSQHGFGGNFTAFSCAGCGKSVESRDGGKTWTPQKTL
jgi:hypothetical protein